MLKVCYFILCFSFIFSIPGKLIGQITFEKAIAPGVGINFIQHNDGFFVIGNNFSLLWLYKVNSFGDTVWSKSYGVSGMNGGTYAGDIQLTSDSNLIIVGGKWPSAATREMYVLKIDTLGNILWEKSIAVAGDLNGITIKETPDNFYIAGGTLENGSSVDIYIVKFDSAGNIFWQNLYNFINKDWFDDLVISTENSYIICGHTNAAIETNVIMFQIDSAGTLSWYKILGDTMTNLLRSMVLTPDSNLILGGYTVSPTTLQIDAWVIKTSITGDTIWSKTFGNQSFYENIYSVAFKDSIIYCAGHTETSTIPQMSLGMVLVIDLHGNFIWQNNYGNLGEGFKDIIFDNSDNSIVATGFTKSFGFNIGVYLIKLNSNGLLNKVEKLNDEIHEYVLYPNPTSDFLWIMKKNKSEFHNTLLEVYNEMGNLVYQQFSIDSEARLKISTQTLVNGIYFIKIYASQLNKNESMISLHKFIKQ